MSRQCHSQSSSTNITACASKISNDEQLTGVNGYVMDIFLLGNGFIGCNVVIVIIMGIIIGL